MAYDEELAERLREQLQEVPGVTERRMFGGLAFMVNGNMAVSASGRGGLLLRVDPVQTDALVQRPGATRFHMRGREMDGWLRIDDSVVRSRRDLARWVRIGVDYARSLQPK